MKPNSHSSILSQKAKSNVKSLKACEPVCWLRASSVEVCSCVYAIMARLTWFATHFAVSFFVRLPATLKPNRQGRGATNISFHNTRNRPHGSKALCYDSRDCAFEAHSQPCSFTCAFSLRRYIPTIPYTTVYPLFEPGISDWLLILREKRKGKPRFCFFLTGLRGTLRW